MIKLLGGKFGKRLIRFQSNQIPKPHFIKHSEPPKTLHEHLKDNEEETTPNEHFQDRTIEDKLVEQKRPSIAPPTHFSSSSNNASTNSSIHKYKELLTVFSKGFAYVGITVCLIILVADQYERLDESERQMKVMKKNQKELVTQMQSYKKKINKAAIETTKKDIIIQGKMQTHIAILRDQLIKNGIEPASVDEALQRFEEEVRIAVTPSSVDLWVPGESSLKALIPDPHEYDQRRS